MYRLKALALTALVALTLAGCAGTAATVDGQAPPVDEFTLPDAVAGTGGLLLLPVLGLAIVALVLYNIDGELTNRVKGAILLACFIVAIIIVLWIAALWLGLILQ